MFGKASFNARAYLVVACEGTAWNALLPYSGYFHQGQVRYTFMCIIHLQYEVCYLRITLYKMDLLPS
jgi:hypothetical protein